MSTLYDSGENPLVSIIIPARNEEGNIPRLERELLSVVEPLPYRFEFIVVDNHSTDRTNEMVKDLCARDGRWKYLRFSRNFTLEMSTTAGYHHARGDAMIVMYSDLQDPPDVIPRFLEKWREGWDVVYGVRPNDTGDPFHYNLVRKLVYPLISWSAEHPIPQKTGDFRLITRPVRDALVQCGENNRYTRGLIAWLGFRQIGISYERRSREAGRSQNSFLYGMRLTFDAITSFSFKPLRLSLFIGVAMTGLSAMAIALFLILYVLGTPPPTGITTLIVLALLNIGLNSLGIGVLGEYLGRTYVEVKQRPLYVVQESVNLEPPAHQSEPRLAAHKQYPNLDP